MAENNRNTNLTIGAATTKVSEAVFPPATRKAICLVNTSTAGQIITLAFGGEAVAGQGIILYPVGSWSETIDSAYVPSQHEINAISSAAGGTLAVQERIVS